MLVVRRLRNESAMNHEGRELMLAYNDPAYGTTCQPKSLTVYFVDDLIVVDRSVYRRVGLSYLLSLYRLNVDASRICENVSLLCRYSAHVIRHS